MELKDLAWETDVAKALAQARRVLDTARTPVLAEDVHHEFSDKYIMTRDMVTAAGDLCLRSLKHLGTALDDALISRLATSASSRTVTLRFATVTNKVTFVKKHTRKLEPKTKYVTETEKGGRKSTEEWQGWASESHEWEWGLDRTYVMRVYTGGNPHAQDAVVLQDEARRTTMLTSSDKAPALAAWEEELDLTWLLQHVHPDTARFAFHIDRTHPECFTPRRNPDVAAALSWFAALTAWTAAVCRCVDGMAAQDKTAADITAAHVDGVDVPVYPLVDDTPAAVAGRIEEGAASTTQVASDREPSACVFPVGIAGTMVAAAAQQLQSKLASLHAVYPAPGDGNPHWVTEVEARTRCVASYLAEVARQTCASVDYIERLLYTQFVAAIGKAITPDDFRQYMDFHMRKLFAPAFAPKGFSYAVRRPGGAPEGTISIELHGGQCGGPRTFSAAAGVPVAMITRSFADREFSFALNAAVRVRCRGATHVHAHVGHRFRGERSPPMAIRMAARQFCRYIVVMGVVTDKHEILPQHAVLLQNKDDLVIPLELAEVPASQDVSDVLAAMSPEQAAFCRAYRSMQLENTLFAMCVIQTKPQLERVLNLPENALTKDIKLTGDLLDLFTEHHIPSDLLAYKPCGDAPSSSAAPGVSVRDRVAVVKTHVHAIHAMLQRSRAGELDAAHMRHAMARAVGHIFDDVPEYSPSFGNVHRPGTAAAAHRATGYAEAEHPRDRPASITSASGDVDVSVLPRVLDARCEVVERDNCLRPATLAPGGSWSLKSQTGLLGGKGDAAVKAMGPDEQRRARERAFDLLTSLTRAGALCIEGVDVHVIAGATHAFDQSIMEAIVQRSMNPIEPVERSLLTLAGAVHDVPVEDLVREGEGERVQGLHPRLFAAG